MRVGKRKKSYKQNDMNGKSGIESKLSLNRTRWMFKEETKLQVNQ